MYTTPMPFIAMDISGIQFVLVAAKTIYCPLSHRLIINAIACVPHVQNINKGLKIKSPHTEETSLQML